MMATKRRIPLVVAVVTVLMMVLSPAGAAFGGSAGKTVCLDGYVINHRELAVDATKTSIPLMVQAFDASGKTYNAAVGSDGYFKFESLPEGDYNFKMQLPEDWNSIAPAAESGALAETGMTTLKVQSTCYRIVFKIRRLFTLTSIKWEEQLDGSVQPGKDWDITASPVNDPFVKAQTVRTDEGGRASFTLTPGDWVISEKVKPCWTPVTPVSVPLKLDQYAGTGALEPVVFKNREPTCHSTIIINKVGYGTDANGNEVQLGPLSGWLVTVRPADNSRPPITLATDALGKATFKVPPDVYSVYEEVKPGWKSYNDDNNPQTITNTDCETTTVTFKNVETKGKLRILGTKYMQAWAKPLNQGPMVGLSGWAITATLVGTDVAITTKTNAIGKYEFTEAMLKAAGMAFAGAGIDVCEEVRYNWIQVTPGCVRVKFPFPLPDNFDGILVNYTNAQDPPLTGAAPSVTATTYTPTSASGGCRVTYYVKRGNTLGNIAARYGTTAAAIGRASGLSSWNNIYPGQRLCIP